MKTLKVITVILLSLTFVKGNGQILISEDFNLGLPAGWSMNPVASWSIHPFFGTSGSKCLYTEEMNTASTTVSFVSSTLNLSGFSTMTLSFKGACTKNNFLVPNIAVFYDDGTGKQLVARWGSGFTSPTTYTMNDVADYQHPLDAANIEWVSCSHTFQAPVSSNVVFYFEAEMINAGYVLLDDIMIAGTNTMVSVGLVEYDIENNSVVFPNPTKEKLEVRSKNIKHIELRNTLGQLILLPITYFPHAAELNTQGLPPGLYNLYIRSGRGRESHKLVIE
jgi:hypothetical protein